MFDKPMVHRFLIAGICMLSSISVFAQTGFPAYIKTSGKLPQLAWSAGTDRLGSAKMGYIDTGIVLKVADTTGRLYKLELCEGRHAFLDSALAKPVLRTSPLMVTTSESWRVKGGEQADSLFISLGRKIAYQSRMEINPSRIVIELYGVQANSNWITQYKSLGEIASVDYRQSSDEVVEITLQLKHPQHNGYHIGYRGNQLLITVRHPPAEFKLKGKTIVVDAGHGGTNVGAKGIQSGVYEKEYTLLIAKEVEKALKAKGAIVQMVRTGDTTIDNKDRVLWAMQQNPDLFISIHLNSAGRPTARGTSTYYKNIGYMPLAKSILSHMLNIDDLKEFGLVGSFNFQPVQPTDYPSALVEVAFLSSPEDESMILDAGFRKKVGKQVCAGIQDWLKGFR